MSMAMHAGVPHRKQRAGNGFEIRLNNSIPRNDSERSCALIIPDAITAPSDAFEDPNRARTAEKIVGHLLVLKYIAGSKITPMIIPMVETLAGTRKTIR